MERRPLTTQRTTTPARAGPGLGPPIRSHEMQHSALLVGLVSDSPGYELPCAEDNSLATAMLPLHRTKKSENRALNSASNIKDYIANGGSVSGLKAEVALGNVILDEANTDILTRGSYLWVSDSELHNNAYITQEVEATIHNAEASNLLWDIPLPDLYCNAAALAPKDRFMSDFRPDLDASIFRLV